MNYNSIMIDPRPLSPPENSLDDYEPPQRLGYSLKIADGRDDYFYTLSEAIETLQDLENDNIEYVLTAEYRDVTDLEFEQLIESIKDNS